MRIFAIMTMGALGALARYGFTIAASAWMAQNARRDAAVAFPLATLVINVFGSFLLAIVVTLVTEKIVSEEWRYAVGVGFLGAFTTFSTFAVEAEALLRRNEWMYSAFYVGGNLVLGILAVIAGRMLTLHFVK